MRRRPFPMRRGAVALLAGAALLSGLDSPQAALPEAADKHSAVIAAGRVLPAPIFVAPPQVADSGESEDAAGAAPAPRASDFSIPPIRPAEEKSGSASLAAAAARAESLQRERFTRRMAARLYAFGDSFFGYGRIADVMTAVEDRDPMAAARQWRRRLEDAAFAAAADSALDDVRFLAADSFVKGLDIGYESPIGDREGSFSVNALMSIFENRRALLFLQLGGVWQESDPGANVGLGLRILAGDGALLGGNVFFDYLDDSDYDVFRRVSFGLEAKSRYADLSANVYRGVGGGSIGEPYYVGNDAVYTADGWDREFVGRIPGIEYVDWSVRHYVWERIEADDLRGVSYRAGFTGFAPLFVDVEYDNPEEGSGGWGVHARFTHAFGLADNPIGGIFAGGGKISEAYAADPWTRRYERVRRRYEQRIVRERLSRLPPPEGLRVGLTAAGVALEWEPVEGADRYRVYRKDNEDFTAANSAADGEAAADGDGDDSNPRFEEDSPGGGVYFYRVAAFADGRGSAPSGSATLTISANGETLAAPALNPPTIARGEGETAIVALSWSAAAGATHYRIYRKTGAAFTTDPADGDLIARVEIPYHFDDFSAPPGLSTRLGTHYYRIVAENAAVAAITSAPSGARSLVIEPPSALPSARFGAVKANSFAVNLDAAARGAAMVVRVAVSPALPSEIDAPTGCSIDIGGAQLDVTIEAGAAETTCVLAAAAGGGRTARENTEAALTGVYQLALIDRDDYDLGAETAATLGPPAAVSAAPTPTETEVVFGEDVILRWPAAALADGYFVIEDDGGVAATVTAVIGAAQTTHRPSASGEYSYRVRAFRNGEDNITLASAASAESELVAIAPRQAARLMVGAVTGIGGGEVTAPLSWDAPDPADSGIAGYLIYRSAAGADADFAIADAPHTVTAAGAVTNYDYRAILAAGEYHFRVAAFADNRAGGEIVGEASDAAGASPSPPETPDGLTATPSGSGVSGDVALEWEPSAGAAAYKIYRGGALIETIGDGATTTFDDDDVGVGVHSYRIAAANAGGDSDQSAAVEAAVPLDAPVLNAPTIASGEGESAIVALSWLAVAGATHYRVYRKTGAAFTAASDDGDSIIRTDALNHQDDFRVPPGLSTRLGTHYYRVIAEQGDERLLDSAASVPQFLGIAVSPPSPPETPAGLTATPSGSGASGDVALEWQAVADATAYKIYRGGVLIATIGDGATTTFGDNDVGVGVHSYRIVAANAGGDSAQSAAEEAAVPLAAAGKPSVAVTDGAVNLSWTKADDGDGVASYAVYRKATPDWSGAGTADGEPVVDADGDATNAAALDADPGSGTTYFYRVVAVHADAALNAAASPSSDAVIVPLDRPQGLTAMRRAGEIDLAWDMVDGADGYLIYRLNRDFTEADGPAVGDEVGGAAATCGGGSCAHTDDGSLTSGTYYYRVIAILAANRGIDSAPGDSASAVILSTARLGAETANSFSVNLDAPAGKALLVTVISSIRMPSEITQTYGCQIVRDDTRRRLEVPIAEGSDAQTCTLSAQTNDLLASAFFGGVGEGHLLRIVDSASYIADTETTRIGTPGRATRPTVTSSEATVGIDLTISWEGLQLADGYSVHKAILRNPVGFFTVIGATESEFNSQKSGNFEYSVQAFRYGMRVPGGSNVKIMSHASDYTTVDFAPQQASGLAVDEIFGHSGEDVRFSLSLDAAEYNGVSGYLLYRSAVGAAPDFAISEAEATVTVSSRAVNGTVSFDYIDAISEPGNYQFKIAAFANKIGAKNYQSAVIGQIVGMESAAAAVEVNARTNPTVAPAAPAGLSAAVSLRSIDGGATVSLDWRAPADSVNVRGHKIFRGAAPDFATSEADDSGNVIATVAIPVESFVDTGPEIFGNHYYRIEAYNDFGNSAPFPAAGDAALAVAVPLTPTEAPTVDLLEWSADNWDEDTLTRPAIVSWTESAEHTANVRYRVKRKIGTSFASGAGFNINGGADIGAVQSEAGEMTLRVRPARNISYRIITETADGDFASASPSQLLVVDLPPAVYISTAYLYDDESGRETARIHYRRRYPDSFPYLYYQETPFADSDPPDQGTRVARKAQCNRHEVCTIEHKNAPFGVGYYRLRLWFNSFQSPFVVITSTVVRRAGFDEVTANSFAVTLREPAPADSSIRVNVGLTRLNDANRATNNGLPAGIGANGDCEIGTTADNPDTPDVVEDNARRWLAVTVPPGAIRASCVLTAATTADTEAGFSYVTNLSVVAGTQSRRVSDVLFRLGRPQPVQGVPTAAAAEGQITVRWNNPADRADGYFIVQTDAADNLATVAVVADGAATAGIFTSPRSGEFSYQVGAFRTGTDGVTVTAALSPSSASLNVATSSWRAGFDEVTANSFAVTLRDPAPADSSIRVNVELTRLNAADEETTEGLPAGINASGDCEIGALADNPDTPDVAEDNARRWLAVTVPAGGRRASCELTAATTADTEAGFMEVTNLSVVAGTRSRQIADESARLGRPVAVAETPTAAVSHGGAVAVGDEIAVQWNVPADRADGYFIVQSDADGGLSTIAVVADGAATEGVFTAARLGEFSYQVRAFRNGTSDVTVTTALSPASASLTIWHLAGFDEVTANSFAVTLREPAPADSSIRVNVGLARLDSANRATNNGLPAGIGANGDCEIGTTADNPDTPNAAESNARRWLAVTVPAGASRASCVLTAATTADTEAGFSYVTNLSVVIGTQSRRVSDVLFRLGRPQPVQGVPTAAVDEDEVAVRWNNPADRADGYFIVQTDTDGALATVAVVADGAATEGVFTAELPGEFSYQVRAFRNGTGEVTVTTSLSSASESLTVLHAAGFDEVTANSFVVILREPAPADSSIRVNVGLTRLNAADEETTEGLQAGINASGDCVIGALADNPDTPDVAEDNARRWLAVTVPAGARRASCELTAATTADTEAGFMEVTNLSVVAGTRSRQIADASARLGRPDALEHSSAFPLGFNVGVRPPVGSQILIAAVGPDAKEADGYFLVQFDGGGEFLTVTIIEGVINNERGGILVAAPQSGEIDHYLRAFRKGTGAVTVTSALSPPSSRWAFYPRSISGLAAGAVSGRAGGSVTVALTWDAPAADPGLDGYKIYRSAVGADGTFAISAAADTVTVANAALAAAVGGKISFDYESAIEAAGTYYFKIVAFADIDGAADADAGDDLDGAADDVSEVTAVVAVSPPPPETPEDLTATPSGSGASGDVALEWRAVADATAYKIYRDAVLIETIGDGATTTFDDNDVGVGVHSYRIAAANAGGDSDQSAAVEAAVSLDAPVLDSLTIASGEGESAIVALSWPAVAGATHYRVYRKTGAAFTAAPDDGDSIIRTSALSHNDDFSMPLGLSSRVGTHYYRVIAEQGDERLLDSAVSAPQLFEIILPPPATPTGFTATASGSGATGDVILIWDSTTGATGYRIYRAGESNPIVEITNGATTYTDPNRGVGIHGYTIEAFNDGGNSARSTPAQTATILLDAPVLNQPTMSGTFEAANVALSWSASTDASGYRVYRKTDAEFTADPADGVLILETDASNILSHDDDFSIPDDLPSGLGTHYYRVIAKHSSDGRFDSAPSARQSLAIIVPAPMGLTATPEGSGSSGYAKLAWKQVPGVIHYVIYLAGEDDEDDEVRTSVSFIHADRDPDPEAPLEYSDNVHGVLGVGTYSYYVVALINLGHEREHHSAPSETVIVNIPLAPALKPRVISNQVNEDGVPVVHLRWGQADGGAGVKHYEVYRKFRPDWTSPGTVAGFNRRVTDEMGNTEITGNNVMDSVFGRDGRFFYRVIAIHENPDLNADASPSSNSVDVLLP